jgi:hypothetical protein
VLVEHLAGVVSGILAGLGKKNNCLLSATLLHELLLRRGVPSKLVKGFVVKLMGSTELPPVGYHHAWVEAAGRQWDVQDMVRHQMGLEAPGGDDCEQALVTSLPPEALDLDFIDDTGTESRTGTDELWEQMEEGTKGLDSVDTYWRLVGSTPTTRALRINLMHWFGNTENWMKLAAAAAAAPDKEGAEGKAK